VRATILHFVRIAERGEDPGTDAKVGMAVVRLFDCTIVLPSMDNRLDVMKKILSSFVLFLMAGLSSATAASAQPYFGGSILADIIRTSGPVDQTPGSGEAIGGALRMGVATGDRWGVDLEFARSGEVEWQPDVSILSGVTLPGVFGALPTTAIFPSPQISFEAQLSTLTTMLWWRQEVNDRFDLVYLGGAAFTRIATQGSVSYILPARGEVLPLPIPQLFEQESVEYVAGVVVGLDGGIGMTEHLRLVPGLRMIAVGSRWIVRPSVGLQWKF
jgi:hypothetical protein